MKNKSLFIYIILLIILIVIAGMLIIMLKNLHTTNTDNNKPGSNPVTALSVNSEQDTNLQSTAYLQDTLSDESEAPTETTEIVLPADETANIIQEETTKITQEETPMSNFYAEPISEEIFNRIYGKSYPTSCTLDLEEIRLLHVSHYNFDGEVATGEIIVNTAIADDVLDIFRELFEINYPIEKIQLIDAYDADDELSMEDNNSSAFNYRYIAETEVLSNHALGFAIDINPLYNPYVYTRKDGSTFLQPYNAGDYVDRSQNNPHFIKKGDACYNIFSAHGFSWGGDWTTKKDYQHFEKVIE